VPIGQTASTTVSLRNEGSAPVQIAQLNLSGQPFSVITPIDLPAIVTAGGTYSLNVQFNPSAAGTATGQLTIASDSSTTGLPVITLSGTGTAGTGSATLSALYCVSGQMTGSGADPCTVTLTAPSPTGGLIVNLSSSISAVAVPISVVVPANATSVGFTAAVSSVASSQAVTMTASAGNLMKHFTLQLNAAILALSINATNVAFGNVELNTPATQSVILTSTGTLPVTISGATLAGAGFTLFGPAFPATLNPGQEATISIEFDPTAAGAATGQLTFTSNSSTNATAIISLSGTGTAPVAVAVAPSTVSTATGATQQFAASVTGTSNTAVTWTVSGTGCSGAICGSISSTGLYTSPATAPSPATAIITATSVSDPSKSASAAVEIVPPTGNTYYLAPAGTGGNDSNSGLSPGTPWLTPNHAVNCGDVLVAAAGVYLGLNFTYSKWGTVNCPTGNSVAWLKCATFDGCKITATGTSVMGVAISKSYWGVQGFEVTATQDTNACFFAYPYSGATIHHIIFANNICNGAFAGGITSSSNGSAGVDYLVIIGNAVYNAAQGTVNCNSGISVGAPSPSNSLSGTHIYVAGNFSWSNVDGNPCGGSASSDGEGIIFDTFSQNSYNQQAVIDNNVSLFNGGRGIQAYLNPSAKIYFRHNTAFGNNTQAKQVNLGNCGEIELSTSVSSEVFLNLAETNSPAGCDSNTVYAFMVASGNNTDYVYQNDGYDASGNNFAMASSTGYTAGPNNLTVNPQFASPVAPGAPSCGSATSVPNCMATLIADFTPTAAKGYGYQTPSSTPVYDPLFPQWLCNVNLPTGLVTLGCQIGP